MFDLFCKKHIKFDLFVKIFNLFDEKFNLFAKFFVKSIDFILVSVYNN